MLYIAVMYLLLIYYPPRSKAANPPPRSLEHCDPGILQNLATAGCCLLLLAVASCLAANLLGFSKINQKGSKNDPNMTPKWTQNGSKLGPLWVSVTLGGPRTVSSLFLTFFYPILGSILSPLGYQNASKNQPKNDAKNDAGKVRK